MTATIPQKHICGFVLIILYISTVSFLATEKALCVVICLIATLRFMPTKKVMVVMDDRLHKLIKALANCYDISISNLIEELVTPGIHRFGLRCALASEIFSQYDVRLDPRVNKWCWGFNCIDCKYLESCKDGFYKGSYISADYSKCLPVAGDQSYGVPDYVHHDFISIESP